MALILNIETGTDVCSVALSENGRLISLRENSEGKGHAKYLAVYIEEILNEMNLKPDSLDAVAVGMGPGSYTGLRIGVSVAKGLCYALGIPLIAVNSLESLVRVAFDDYKAGIMGIDNLDNSYLCPMIDARRMEVYCQIYDGKDKAITPIEAKIIGTDSFEEFISDKQFVIFGNGASKCRDLLNGPNVRYVDVIHSASGMVDLSAEAFAQNNFVDTAYFEPFYLKDFVMTTTPKKLF
ncbi:MAG: tRNA (adenosine(37)-N6)-threonylcarbamoyltransferase complex dimerization subunit type 1 TsaB [Rikenellaceae bacterium]|nr:tRNA (adenosine(37)-N6)-threonylcarbamoyltransferase complex dimerization subunit type 1 TsaB [Rikenellaceae bacterium]